MLPTIEEQLKYWKSRAEAVDRRNDQLVAEILRLKGRKPLTEEQIEKYNKEIRRGDGEESTQENNP